jgi:hypothetical protein
MTYKQADAAYDTDCNTSPEALLSKRVPLFLCAGLGLYPLPHRR